ncbi:MAG: hypothetical protein WD749_09240 [Phycisphaerales bacterium]
MATFEARSHVDATGKLVLHVPPSFAGSEVRVVVESTNGASPGRPTRAERSATLRRLSGSITDPTFGRPPQGEFERRGSLD